MVAPFRPFTRCVLNSATHISDFALQGLLERSAQRLGQELRLPAHFIQQLLAVEDKRFAWHPGIDPVAVVRAVMFNLGVAPARPHGASTIVQQTYSGAQRRTGNWSPNLRCKLAQSAWAVHATVANSKPSLLRTYVDSVYFGRSFYGLRQASAGYCGRAPQEIDVSEAFFLVERIGRPNVVSARRVGMLITRAPIVALFRADPAAVQQLPAHYERNFGCGEEIARCLERSLRKPVERTFMSSEVVSNEQ
jgi:hypothetical protein